MRLVLPLLVLPALASAAPRFSTSVRLTVDGAPAAFEIAVKLDACWRRPTRAKARITIDAGKITNVEVVETGDPRARKCIAKALRAATTSTTASAIAVIELDGHKPGSDHAALERIVNAEAKLDKFVGLERLDADVAARGTGGGGTAVAKTSAKQPGIVASDGGGPTANEIDRVMRARARIFRECYQKELARTPGLGGRLVASFRIGADGAVVFARIKTERSTLKNKRVEDCVLENIRRAKFPATGSEKTVNYPFIFSSAG